VLVNPADPSAGVPYGPSLPYPDVATLPADFDLTYTLPAVWSNGTAICTEVHDRVAESFYRVPERMVLACAGLRLAQLAPGDVVDLTTKRFPSRRDGLDGFAGRRVLVDEVSPDWDRGTVRVGLLVYPESEDAFA
jgi:hypothetical protein